MAALRIVADGSEDFGPCDCCGKMSRVVMGYVTRSGDPQAAYFVQWTLGAVDAHGVNVDLIIGRMKEDVSASERRGVSLAFRRTPPGPGFMLIDATTRPVARNPMVGVCLRREDVVGTPLAKQAYDLVDVVWLEDRRLREITGS